MSEFVHTKTIKTEDVGRGYQTIDWSELGKLAEKASQDPLTRIAGSLDNVRTAQAEIDDPDSDTHLETLDKDVEKDQLSSLLAEFQEPASVDATNPEEHQGTKYVHADDEAAVDDTPVDEPKTDEAPKDFLLEKDTDEDFDDYVPDAESLKVATDTQGRPIFSSWDDISAEKIAIAEKTGNVKLASAMKSCRIAILDRATKQIGEQITNSNSSVERAAAINDKLKQIDAIATERTASAGQVDQTEQLKERMKVLGLSPEVIASYTAGMSSRTASVDVVSRIKEIHRTADTKNERETRLAELAEELKEKKDARRSGYEYFVKELGYPADYSREMWGIDED